MRAEKEVSDAVETWGISQLHLSQKGDWSHAFFLSPDGCRGSKG